METDSRALIPMRWVAFASAAYVGIAVVAAYVLGFVNIRCLGAPVPSGCLSPSEWGDVLAGVFSPLAFFWLVYTASMQTKELALQRQELLKNNVSQEEQARALKAQARRLDAQAIATLEPIFQCEWIAFERTSMEGGDVVVQVINRGHPVVDATPAPDFHVREDGDTAVAGMIQYWGHDRVFRFSTRGQDDFRDYELIIDFIRLDATKVRHRYSLLRRQRRLELLERTQLSESEDVGTYGPA